MKRLMKKTLAAVLTLSMVAMLCACGEGNLLGTAADPNVAKVIIGEEETEYENMTDAWAAVNNSVDKDCELVLLADWTAEDGSFGTGDGYGTTGNLTPKDRKKDSIKLTIDLNGFTLNRNLEEPVESGNIISLKKDGVFTIKNGTLTGGNTTQRGGAIWMDNDETKVYLENMTITGNYAQGNGGAIFCKDSFSKLFIKDTTITGNTSENYGGAIYVQTQEINPFDQSHYTEITLSGVVVAKDNTGKDNRNNICLQNKSNNWSTYISYIYNAKELGEGSEIYIAPSNFKTGKLVVNEGNNGVLKKVKGYFYSDNPKRSIEYQNDNEGNIEYIFEY